MTRKTILFAGGARPNFMKLAPLIRAFRRYPEFHCVLVHTGQHYSKELSDVFFRELNLPHPSMNFGIRSGSHLSQIAHMLLGFERAVARYKPVLIVAVGDVNSTLAAALAAGKLHIPLAHVEAGLRSNDRSMPEELNRILTDHIAEFLFVTESSAIANLSREGVPKHRIIFVGNVMIDCLKQHASQIRQSRILQKMELTSKRYVVITLHRPSNVDSRKQMTAFYAALKQMIHRLPHLTFVFPVHPHTSKRLKKFKLQKTFSSLPGLVMVRPMGYFDFLRLVSDAAAVLTDSGGIQEETTYFNVPCLTLRDSTERPITVTAGTNQVIGTDMRQLPPRLASTLANHRTIKKCPPLWDGKSAARIAGYIAREFGKNRRTYAHR